MFTIPLYCTGALCTFSYTVSTNRESCQPITRALALGVKHLAMAIGGSMGSMLALEWAATYPDFVEELVLIAGCGRHTDWAIGIGEAQRYAIMADSNFNGGAYDMDAPPKAGLATSRMMAMLSYRAPASVRRRKLKGGAS